MNDELFQFSAHPYIYQVDNQAIVVPETIEAIRALTGSVRTGAESMRLTDDALGMRRDFLVSTPEAGNT